MQMKLLVARSVSPSLLLRSSTFNVVLYSKKKTSSLRKPSQGGGCLEIRGGGVPPGSPHPDPISN